MHAQACRRTQSTLRNPAPLLCGRLLAALRDVAADKGQGVAARRQAVVLGLLRACRDVEVRFLVRTLISVSGSHACRLPKWGPMRALQAERGFALVCAPGFK